jgi:hypothetical protein
MIYRAYYWRDHWAEGKIYNYISEEVYSRLKCGGDIAY